MVEGGGLENRCAARYRGFESPLLRIKKRFAFFNLNLFRGFEPERLCKNFKGVSLA